MQGNNEVRVYSEDNIAKSNVLIQSKSRTTILGNKLIALGLYHLQKGDYKASSSGGNIVCTLTAAEIRQRLGKTGNSLYRDLDTTAKRLLKYELSYKDPEKKEFRYINLFTEMVYKDGEFTITFNGDMKSYLHELKDNYTLLNLPLMLKWTRTYTFRLFEILSSRAYLYKNKGYQCEATYGLAELKFTIGCYDIEDEKVRLHLKDKQNPDYEAAEQALYESTNADKNVKTYLKWYDFKRNVIDPAVEEINSTSEANMIIDSVEPLKKGKGGKVYGVVFKYRVNTQSTEAEEETAATEIIMSEEEKFEFEVDIKSNVLGIYKLPITDIRALCNAAEYNLDRIQYAADRLAEQTGTINNITGWLLSCIKNEYSEAISRKGKTKKTAFNDFQQREYSEDDMEQLELNLLGWKPKE